MNSLLQNLSPILITIILIVTVFAIIRIIRFIYNYLRYIFLTHKYKVRYDKATLAHLKKHQGKPDEILEKNKKAEQELKIAMRKLNGVAPDKEQTTIVAIAEPKGIWTKFITDQKMSWLKAMVGTKAESDKFWQNMIEAQGKAQGKYKGQVR